MDEISSDVDHWWYHYYCQGDNKKIRNLSPENFKLSHSKYTPDFKNYQYDYGICHPQIGRSVTEKKSIVLIKTTVGVQGFPEYVEKNCYVVGYYKVKAIDTAMEIIHIDENDSLLLFGNPIKIDSTLAKRLFTDKVVNYWQDESKLVRKIGSTLRNKKASPNEVKIIIDELKRRFNDGATNYFGDELAI